MLTNTKPSSSPKQATIRKSYPSCALMLSTRAFGLSIDEIKSLLSRQSWSPPVYEWRVESELDSIGEPAIWVWAVYDVAEVDLEAARQAESWIRKTIADAGDDRFVYVRFWTREEYEEEDVEDNDEGFDQDLSPVSEDDSK